MSKTIPLVVGNIGKDMNVKTFQGVTNISVVGDATGEIKLRVPTNLRAVVENTTKRIEECESIVDEILLPSIVQADYDRTVMEFDFESKERDS